MLEKVESCFLERNLSLTEINLPSLIRGKKEFLSNNNKITRVYLPVLECIPPNFHHNNIVLEALSLPSVTYAYLGLLEKNNVIKILDLPNLKEYLFQKYDYVNAKIKELMLENIEKNNSGLVLKH